MSTETLLTDHGQAGAAKLAQQLLAREQVAFLHLTDTEQQDFEFPATAPGACRDFTEARPGKYRVLEPAALAAALQQTARDGKDHRTYPGYLLDGAGRAFIVVMDTWLESEHRPMEDEYGQELTDEHGNVPRIAFSLVDFSFAEDNPLAHAPRTPTELVQRFYAECPGAHGKDAFEYWLTNSVDGGQLTEDAGRKYYAWKTLDGEMKAGRKNTQNILSDLRKAS